MNDIKINETANQKNQSHPKLLFDLFLKSPNRLAHIDIVRFLAILFMVLSHVEIMYASEEFYYSFFGQVIDFLAGPPAAPVFMTSMGFLVAYSQKFKLKPGLLRGLKIFLIGILLNLIRFVIPVALGTWWEGILYEDAYGETLGENLLFLFFEVDILVFAGLAYIILILNLQFKPKITLIFTFFIVAIISPLLWGLYTSNAAFNIFLDFLWGDRAHVAFPLFPWLAYPILGGWIGIHFISYEKKKDGELNHQLQIKENNREIGKKIILIGFGLLITGLMIVIFDFEQQIGDYYHSGPGAIFLYSGFVIVWFYVFLNLGKFVKGRVKIFIEFVSNNLTSIYCIHWTILGWLMLLLPDNSYGILGFSILFLTIFPTSVFLSKYIKIKI